MTWAVIVFYNRKPGKTPAEFQDEFEKLMPTITEHTASTFPIYHARHYVKRSEDGIAEVERGTQEDFPFDGMNVIEFESREDMEKFAEARHGSPYLKQFDVENGASLPDRTTVRIVVLSGSYITKKPVAA